MIGIVLVIVGVIVTATGPILMINKTNLVIATTLVYIKVIDATIMKNFVIELLLFLM